MRLVRTLLHGFGIAIWCVALLGTARAAEAEFSNRLIDANSPYLLLHAHNPVDWYPWGSEALEKAKRENKPIFLSIGYSTCYWCHVAERTLFSNPAIAKLMNQWFVNIKVDREERPDVDAIYLLATQLLTSGSGGWPNNVFLTPDLKPFYAGGYFPPEDDDLGRPGFPSVLAAVHDEWSENPERVRQRADGVVAVLRERQAKAHDSGVLEPERLSQQAREAILQRFDAEYGGFGRGRSGTKFPQSPTLALMVADYARSRDPAVLRFLTTTLDAMAYGGLYDQLGDGFHRYTTDRAWSIPHFEKMLYDNAQLLAIYARAWQLTGEPQYRRIALGVRNYLRGRMLARDGGFYTAEDAAVEGDEGASYVWSRAEADAVLGDDAPAFFATYELTPMPREVAAIEPETARGVLRVRWPAQEAVETELAALDGIRSKLLQARSRRAQPARDEKVLVGLNGLAIEAFVAAGTIFESPDDAVDARRSATRIWELAWDDARGRLAHQIYRGNAQGDGFLDDYAMLGRGFLALYRSSGETVWLQRAQQLATAMLQRFDPDDDGVLAATTDTATLILAPMDEGDDAYPSGTSAAVSLLAQLGLATNDHRYTEAATRIARRVADRGERWPALVAAVADAGLRGEPVAIRAEGTASHVQVSGVARVSAEHDEIVVTLQVADGFHVNANPASFDFLLPTAVTFAGLQPSAVRYPAPIALRSSFAPDVLNVYEGTVHAVALFPSGALCGMDTIQATLATQACTEAVCLPPSKIPFVVHVDHDQK